MASTPKKKSSRAKAQKPASANLDAARRASQAAAAASSDSNNDTGINPFQPPFGMPPMPPFPMGQPGAGMGGPNPMMPPIPPGAFQSPTATGNLLDSVGTMIKLGIDTINAALAGSNQLLQGMSGPGYYSTSPYPHHHHGCEHHGYMHPHGHHCCQHNHYHDSYGHSCCDHYGDNCCYPSVHNCCK